MKRKMKAAERIGQTINNMKILDFKRENEKTYYYIECQLCHSKKWKRADTVINPKIKSCGCLSASTQFKSQNLLNKRFGRLTVVAKTNKRDSNNGSVIWLCKCDCGNEKEVSSYILNKGGVRSCGCLAKDAHKRIGAEIGEATKEVSIDGTNVRNLTMKISKRNTSGIKGVVWDKERKKWLAQIKFKGKKYFLGRFNNIEEARKVRERAEEKIFGDFLNWYNEIYLNEKGKEK